MPASHIGGRGQQLQLGFRHDSKRAFAASRTDRSSPSPARADIRRCSWWCRAAAARARRNRFCRRACTSSTRPVHQRHSQPKDMPARAAITKAARSAGVGGDGPADAGGALGRIGRVELAGARRGGLQLIERYARAHDRAARTDFETPEFFERDRPSALRHAAAGQSGARANDRDGNAARAIISSSSASDAGVTTRSASP